MNISKVTNPKLSSIYESLLLPLYIRAREAQRSDAILRDECAVDLVHKLNVDESQFAQAQVSVEVQVSILLRNRQFDRITQAFLIRNPDSVVVHLGCGLDSRFERVDNQQVEWYDLDLPQVIDLRRDLIGGESCRYHLLAYSALDHAWMDTVTVQSLRAVIILAEGLFMFFEQAQVMQLVLALKDHFPNAELAFDAFSPFYVWGNNRRVARTKVGALAYWALKHANDLEGWASGIHLLDEWYPFLADEPRLSHIGWVRFIPFLAKTTGIFHYRFEST